MHISVEKEKLQTQLELLGKVSTKHVTLPVLQCVLLQTKGDALILKATNLEIGIETQIPATVTQEGSIAVPAATLLQTIQYIHAKDIVLKVEGSILVVETKTSKTNIKSIPHEEFPSIPTLNEKGQLLNGKLFSVGIKTAAFAASASSIKPELGSIYILQKKEHTLTFVATDSFRLMEKTVSQKGVSLQEAILIPQKNALELARVCDSKETDPLLKVNENQCALVFDDGTYITSRLTSGSFPDYAQIIPKEYETHSTLLKDDLANTFKKTSVFLNTFMQVRLEVQKDKITVSADSSEVGTTTESVHAQTDGGDLSLSFNQRYIAEPLSHITDESIIMHFAGIGRPLVMEGVHDKSLRYLVMPMNK